jgi:hypothetical protein
MKIGVLATLANCAPGKVMPFSALFPEIRDLPTMKGLLDLERQAMVSERQTYTF